MTMWFICVTHTNQWLSRNLGESAAQCGGPGRPARGGPCHHGNRSPSQPRAAEGRCRGQGKLRCQDVGPGQAVGTSEPLLRVPLMKAPSAPMLGGPGFASEAQAPDEVEEEDRSQDAIERNVGDEETDVVADGPGQVLPRETRWMWDGPPHRHYILTMGVYTAPPVPHEAQVCKKHPRTPGALGSRVCKTVVLERCRVFGSRKGAACSDFRETNRGGDPGTPAEEYPQGGAGGRWPFCGPGASDSAHCPRTPRRLIILPPCSLSVEWEGEGSLLPGCHPSPPDHSRGPPPASLVPPWQSGLPNTKRTPPLPC